MDIKPVFELELNRMIGFRYFPLQSILDILVDENKSYDIKMWVAPNTYGEAMYLFVDGREVGVVVNRDHLARAYDGELDESTDIKSTDYNIPNGVSLFLCQTYSIVE